MGEEATMVNSSDSNAEATGNRRKQLYFEQSGDKDDVEDIGKKFRRCHFN